MHDRRLHLARGRRRLSLAAEEALERDLPIVAYPPLVPDEYERDFGGEDLVRFRRLLASAARVSVVSGADRERSYLAAGSYVAHHCHLLVAFWDGRPPHGLGGTAHIVSARLGEVDVKTLADERAIDLGPVIQIATARPDTPVAEPGAIAVRYPLPLTSAIGAARAISMPRSHVSSGINATSRCCRREAEHRAPNARWTERTKRRISCSRAVCFGSGCCSRSRSWPRSSRSSRDWSS